MIAEPDVALTDYGLAVECGLFAWVISRQGHRSLLAGWFTFFFVSLSLGAVFGGTVHGFFGEESSLGYKILWPATLVSIGMMALAVWGIAATTAFSMKVARRVQRMGALLFALYVGGVFFLRQPYWIAIVDYLPPAFFLLSVWTRVYFRTRTKPVLWGVVGLALTVVAAGVQIGQVAVHPVYFNHNALYHLIQAVALYLMFLAARWFASEWKAQRSW